MADKKLTEYTYKLGGNPNAPAVPERADGLIPIVDLTSGRVTFKRSNIPRWLRRGEKPEKYPGEPIINPPQ